MEYEIQAFIFLRPIFIAFIIILIALLCIIIFQKKQLANLFSVISISLISFTISAITLYSSGYIIDEYGLRGDEISFFMFIAIVGISLVNVIVYLTKNRVRKFLK